MRIFGCVLVLGVFGAAALTGCGGDVSTASSGSGGGGGGDTSAGSGGGTTSGAGGATGSSTSSTSSGGPQQVAADCKTVCDALASCDQPSPTCTDDCENAYQQAGPCSSAFVTLVHCMASSSGMLDCNDPPNICPAESQDLQTCAMGCATECSASNTGDCSCTRSSCNGHEETATCTPDANGAVTCTCSLDGANVGTCTQPSCDIGCCDQFFPQ